MKIDTSTITGYAEMSAEDKIKALEGFEYDDNSAELERLKNANSKANSEAAEWKRKHNALLSEDEKKQQEKDSEFAQMKEELQKLKDEKALGELTNHYLSLGYDKDLAVDTAKARMAGDQAKEFANGEKHRQSLEKKLKEQLMDGTHKPDGAGGDDGKDKPDAAVERAKEIAKSYLGSDGQNYESTMKNYL